MARPQDKNLKPFTSDQNREEAKKNGKKGGVASGEARRRKRDMRECLAEISKLPAPESVTKAFKKQGLDVPEGMTYYEALTYSMMMRGLSGDSKMVSLIMDVMGERNSDKLREKELTLKEKELSKGKSDALEKLDSIIQGLKDNAVNTDSEAK